MIENIYQPTVMRIAASRDEAPDVRTLRLEFSRDRARQEFFAAYRVGQFGLYGVPGAGESVFCIASPPTRQEFIECTFRRVGRVTSALQDREVGQTVTFRGPYGTHFPIDSWRGRNLLFVAGGIALPPLRSVIWNILDRRQEFGRVTIVYGARTVADLVYKDELADWAARGDVKIVTTVDPGLAETEFSLVRFKGDAGRAKRVYEGINPLTADDVAETMVWVASRPPHVNIDDLLIKPVDQAAIHKVHRRKS